jgi:hypothetical protein
MLRAEERASRCSSESLKDQWTLYVEPFGVGNRLEVGFHPRKICDPIEDENQF